MTELTMTNPEDEAVTDAIHEARRFIQRADAYLATDTEGIPSRERAAMRRASLDLTMALSKMRKEVPGG
jgi:hypothetical protein